MKLTRASSYAIRALAVLARSHRPIASHNIAKENGTPERFLLKVLKPLVQAGVLRSIKGPNGGYQLARNPRDVNMLQVIQAVDGPLARPDPFPEDELNRKLFDLGDRVATAAEKVLCKVTLEDLR